MAGSAHAQGLADLAEWEGDLDAARAALADGRRSDRGYLLTSRGSWYAVHEAGLALEAGDVEHAAAIWEQLTGGDRHATWFVGLSCHVACRTGDLPAARLALARLLELGPLSGSLVHDVVSAALRAGLEVHELRPLADRVASHPPLHAAPPTGEEDAAKALVNAQLAEAAGDPEAALPLYALAATAENALFPSERGTAHVGAARCALALGRLDDAKAELAAAEDLLSRWSGWRVDELEDVRRRLGGSPAAVTADLLTPREREVVALIAEGLTNAELAGRLYISPKTAAVHVSNVLAKLHMASRTEVATWAIREGIAT
jgi:DNA-binding NarL/FixJ family response regulator